MTPEEMSNVVENLNTLHGSTIDFDGIRKVLFDSQQKRIEENGRVAITGSVKPSDTSVRNYTAILANHPFISIKHSYVSKTMTRSLQRTLGCPPLLS